MNGHPGIRFKWVIYERLARSHRPGRWEYKQDTVPAAAVESWIDVMRNHGIKSIICLLNDDQLKLYADACQRA